MSEDRSHISTLNETVMLIFLFTFEKPPFLLKLGMLHSCSKEYFCEKLDKAGDQLFESSYLFLNCTLFLQP